MAFPIPEQNVFELATERFAALQTSVKKHFGAEFDFANQLISEFVDFEDTRHHKARALAKEINHMLSAEADTLYDIFFKHNGIQLQINEIKRHEGEEEVMNHRIVEDGECYCYGSITQCSYGWVHFRQAKLFVGGCPAHLARVIVECLEEGTMCQLCGKMTSDKFGICRECLYIETEIPCSRCKRKIGFLGGDTEHAVCKKRRLNAEQAAQRAARAAAQQAAANSNNPP